MVFGFLGGLIKPLLSGVGGQILGKIGGSLLGGIGNLTNYFLRQKVPDMVRPHAQKVFGQGFDFQMPDVYWPGMNQQRGGGGGRPNGPYSGIRSEIAQIGPGGGGGMGQRGFPQAIMQPYPSMNAYSMQYTRARNQLPRVPEGYSAADAYRQMPRAIGWNGPGGMGGGPINPGKPSVEHDELDLD